MWIHRVNAKPQVTGLGCLWGLGFGGLGARGREGGESERETQGGALEHSVK